MTCDFAIEYHSSCYEAELFHGIPNFQDFWRQEAEPGKNGTVGLFSVPFLKSATTDLIFKNSCFSFFTWSWIDGMKWDQFSKVALKLLEIAVDFAQTCFQIRVLFNQRI